MFGFGIVILHLFLIFYIGLRFVTPQAANAVVVQHTIQLIPRLSEPTLVTAVLVEDNTEVKKGQPLFQFDRTIYEGKVAQLEAELAAAKQNVNVLRSNLDAANSKIVQAVADLAYAEHQKQIYERLVREGSTRTDEVTLWTDKVAAALAGRDAARAQADAANYQYNSNINGVNTNVASTEAQLQQAKFYLDNTTMRPRRTGAS